MRNERRENMRKILILTPLLFLFFNGCAKEAPKVEILCGTTMIQSLVRDLAPEMNTAVLVPYNSCPGTYDLKPGDAKTIASAKIILIHPFQSYLAGKFRKLNKEAAVEIMKTAGLPEPHRYMEGQKEMAGILLKYFPGNEGKFNENIDAYVKEFYGRTSRDKVVLKYPVLSSVLQKEFALSAGFLIAGLFGSPDSLTPERLKQLIMAAKEQKVRYIISNMTGDNDVSADIINNELKVRKIVLSGFPAQDTSRFWYFNLYNYNMARIKEALEGK